MYLGGRWVPLELVGTLFIVWGISAVLLAAVVLWFSRRRPPIDRRQKRVRPRREKRRTSRFRR